MKTKYIITGTLALMAAFSVQSQTPGAGGTGSAGQGTTGANQNLPAGSPSQQLPPGLQNREQLPPGLQNREQLPPGLAKRTNAVNQGTAQVQTGTSAGAGYGLNTTNAGAIASGATNTWSSATNYGATSNLWNTNRYGGTTTNATGLLPTGQSTNRVYGTNTSSTSTTSTTSRTVFRDQAYTPQDRTLLVTVRQQVQPVLRSITTTATTTTTPGAVLEPINFVVREGVITLVGFVPTVEARQEVVAAVQQIPGVVRVVDQLEVRTTDTTATGGTVDVQESTTGAGTSTPGALHDTQTSSPSATSSTNDRTSTSTTTSTNIVQPVTRPEVAVTNRTSGRLGLSLTNLSGSELPPANNGSGLQPTSDRANTSVYQTNRSLPPGLQKRDELPPGLEKRDELPPGLRNRTNNAPEPADEQ